MIFMSQQYTKIKNKKKMLNSFWVAYKITENRINQKIRKLVAHTRCATIQKKNRINTKKYTFVWMDAEY